MYSPTRPPQEWWQTRTGWAVAAYVLVAALLFGVFERFFPQLTVVALVVTIPGALVVCAYVLYQVFVLAREGPPTDRRSRTQQGHRTRREPIPRSVKMYVWQRDGGRCVECGSRERLEYDHIIPLSEGGSNTDRNIQLLCERCNRRKGARII